MKLRKYQEDFHQAVVGNLANGSKSTLGVMATGLGKTVSAAHLADYYHKTRHCRTLFLAHREELIHQAYDTYHLVTGEKPDIEMGELKADATGMFSNSHHVIASIQTLCRPGRHLRFDPDGFGFIVWDEAHHCALSKNKSYNAVFKHFTQNPNIRHLGLSATPDRADEEALGQMFDSVSFDYGIRQGINDGWLVDIEQQYVHVEGLDISRVRTHGGDLHEGDLAQVLDEDKILHRILAPTFELAGDKPCLVFMPPRKRGDQGASPSEKAADILNGYRQGCAAYISGNPYETDRDERRRIVNAFRNYELQFLVGCGVFVEGFDAPSAAVIAMARMTSSRSFYAQAAGRATRPAKEIVNQLNNEPDAALRRAIIANSIKPKMLMLDFVGNSGRHKLVSSADILGGNYSDEVVAKAKENAEKKAKPTRTEDELEEAKKQILAEQKLRRQQYIAKAKYSKETVDPFSYTDTVPTREPGWHKGRKPSEKQIGFLEGQGVKEARDMSFWEAHNLITEIIKWRNEKMATFKQRRQLMRFGYDPCVTFERASEIMTELANNGWRRK